MPTCIALSHRILPKEAFTRVKQVTLRSQSQCYILSRRGVILSRQEVQEAMESVKEETMESSWALLFSFMGSLEGEDVEIKQGLVNRIRERCFLLVCCLSQTHRIVRLQGLERA